MFLPLCQKTPQQNFERSANPALAKQGHDKQ